MRPTSHERTVGNKKGRIVMLPKVLTYYAEEHSCLKCGKPFFKKVSFPQQKYCSKNCQSSAATQRWVARGVNKHGRFMDIPAIRRGNSTVRKRFYTLKSSAKLRGLQVDMPFETYQMLVSGSCHWCDGELPTTGGSLDRLDNSVGYTPDNCVPCCTQCNTAKGCLTPEAFVAWVARVFHKAVNRG
jgi:hypothetical protein